jgi:hypothetical protein
MRDSIDETNVERELKTLIRKWQDVDWWNRAI